MKKQIAAILAALMLATVLLSCHSADTGQKADENPKIFFGREDVHPMIQALNALNYDVGVTGNHEYNYGMDVVRKAIADFRGKVLTGNVYDTDGSHIADGWTIMDVDGVRVALIGMVTPNIARWDEVNLKGCEVTDPQEETRKIIDSIRGQYDVLIGVFHMSVDNEYDVPNSGVADILDDCPEFDVMVAAHEHVLIPSMDINGTLVVENMSQARTMSVIDLTLEKDGEGWKVADKSAESVSIADYEADPAMMELLAPYDTEAREDAQEVVGRLEGGPLAPEPGEDGNPAALVRDTALIDLINDVQLHYTGAQVSGAALLDEDANMQPGDICKSDMARIFKYSNTLYKLRMTGAQLKKYMEWSANYYNTFQPGDQTITFDQDIPIYNYDMFAGVRYEVNIANPAGSRIENLTWPDGEPVKDEDEFEIAVNNYRATTQLLEPGTIYEEDELPELVEMDVHGEKGGVREMIRDYIVMEKGGVIRPECDENWRITGIEQ